MLLAQASELARDVDRTFWIAGAVTLALLLLVTGLMVAFAVRYRRSRSRTVSQTTHHTVLEITWIVLPTIIVCWMFTIGVEPFARQRDVPEGAYVVQVTGRQWAWSFHYPDANVDSTELIVPLNVAVKLELTSAPSDVIHGFYIPDFRVKEDALPGQQTYLWFKGGPAWPVRHLLHPVLRQGPLGDAHAAEGRAARGIRRVAPRADRQEVPPAGVRGGHES